MKLVRENINFQRGIDPRRAMGIGSFDEIKREFHEDTNDTNYTSDEDYNDEIDMLRWAVRKGNLDYTKIIYDNASDKQYALVIMLKRATTKGHIHIVQYAIDEGVPVWADDNFALRWACKMGRTEIVKLLIENDADVDAVHGAALTNAIENGRLEIMQILIDAGIKLDVQYEGTNDFMTTAAERDQLEAVKLLIKNGVKVSHTHIFRAKRDTATREFLREFFQNNR